MPIRRLTIHACTYGVMLACATSAQAGASLWNGSYVAEDSCYCVGEQSRYIDSQIVPTPIGGQSVAQVCKRLSNGPMLQKFNEKFNFTVYPDAQCGNGPFPDAIARGNDQCLGHLGINGEDCATRGPRWNLSEAYAKDATPPVDNSTNSLVTGGSRHIKPPVKRTASKTVEAQQAENTSVAEIARIRANSKKIARKDQKVEKVQKVKQAQKPVVPETREQIRARQLVHLEAARKRAELANADQINSDQNSVEGLLPQVAAASGDADKAVTKGSTIESAKVKSSISQDTNIASVEADDATPVKPESASKSSLESVAESTKTPAVVKESPTVPALKVPAGLGPVNPQYDYFEASPLTYDFGGAGLGIAVSKSSHNRMQYVLKAAAADTYREASIGFGMFFQPAEAERTTLMVRAGLEYGLFNFRNEVVKADLSDTGVFAEFASRYAFTRKFDLQAGVSYSSFFEGDAVVYSAAFYQLTPKLDLTVKSELGDNNLIGFGIRYHY